MFWKKKEQKLLVYDKEKVRPVIKSSICTGEKVAGFQEKDTGKFEDIMLIRSAQDLELFCSTYGISQDEIGKIW